MSARELTQAESQDLVTLVLPRVIVEALANPDGEFYDGEVFDAACERALKLYD
jgi:hypothetical protein